MELNGKNVKTIMKIIVTTVLLCFALINISEIVRIGSKALSLFTPLIIGICLSFILNVLLNVWENKGLKRVRISQRKKRMISILLTFVSVILILAFVMWMVIPQLISAGESIAKQFPDAIEKLQKFLDQNMKGNDDLNTTVAQLGVDSSQFIENLTGYLKNSLTQIMSTMVQVVSGTFSVLMNLFIGIIFAIYILSQKEQLISQAKQVTNAFLPEKVSSRIFEICSLANETFQKFVTGQCLEAVIIGSIFGVVMSIFRMPYAIPISVLIMITALIPVFGAFIGCFVGVLMILVVSPMQALIFVILFLVIQQIEGNLIYPHVVGGSVGLPSIWVFAAVIIGGNLLGIVGMLIFIPLCSVAYALFKKSVKQRLQMKQGKGSEKEKTN